MQPTQPCVENGDGSENRLPWLICGSVLNDVISITYSGIRK